jgi:hypothetical protein
MQIQQENATAIDNNIPELGHQQTVSHVDLGQFPTHGDTGTGRFTCGLAALNCVRTVFEKEGRGIKGEQLLREVLARETAQVSGSASTHPFATDSHLLNQPCILLIMATTPLLYRKSTRFAHTGIVRLITWT